MTYEERIAELEKQLADLKAEIKSAEAAPGVWEPGMGEWYFFLDDRGTPASTFNAGVVATTLNLKDRRSIGNCFRTKEEAEFAVERLKVLAEMRKYAKGFKPDWSNTYTQKYLLYVRTDCANSKRRYVVVADYNTINHGIIYFASVKDAKACIDGIGEERLLKYYFGEEVDNG